MKIFSALLIALIFSTNIYTTKHLFKNLTNPTSGGIGNTCWFDSVLQCLLNIERLHYGFETIDHKFENLPEGNVKKALEALCKLAKKPSEEHQKNLYNAVVDDSSLNKWEQNDAAEFLTYLFGKIFDDSNLKKDYKEIHQKINHIFSFQTLSTVKCTKFIPPISNPKKDPDHYSETIGLQNFLALPIPSNDNKIHTLSECFSLFTKEETLEETYCYTCKKSFTNSMKKQLFMFNSPQVLAIQLKRFEYVHPIGFRKLKTKISFPTTKPLSIATFFPKDENVVAKIDPQNYQALYKLIGVVLHSGTLSSGHYTAYSFEHETKKWIFYNDLSSTIEIFENQVNFDTEIKKKLEQPYLLFYQKINPLEQMIRSLQDFSTKIGKLKNVVKNLQTP